MSQIELKKDTLIGYRATSNVWRVPVF